MEIHAASYLYPELGVPLEGGALAVMDGVIVAVGNRLQLAADYGGIIHDYPGCIIMPALVNPHTHLELTHFPAWKIRKGVDYAPRTFIDWIEQVIKVRRALSHDELVASLREGLRLCLECGVTMVGEILTDRSLLPHYLAAGVSGRLFFEAIGHDADRCSSLLSEIADCCTSLSGEKLLPAISPHAPYTVSSALVSDLAAFARMHSLPLSIHVAEWEGESVFFMDSTGPIATMLYPYAGWEKHIPAPRHTTSTAWLDSLGVLSPATTIVHGVHLSDDDIDILARRGSGVILCPRSNERLSVGKAPVARLKEAGIRLSVGTDSLASNDSLSPWDELHALHDIFPGLFSMEESISLVTSAAACAIGHEGRGGVLAPGVQADFLVLEPGKTLSGATLATSIVENPRVQAVFMGGRSVR